MAIEQKLAALALDTLTPRQKEIARRIWLAQGNKQIASEIRISVGTVKTHIIRIRRKLSAENRVAVARIWQCALQGRACTPKSTAQTDTVWARLGP